MVGGNRVAGVVGRTLLCRTDRQGLLRGPLSKGAKEMREEPHRRAWSVCISETDLLYGLVDSLDHTLGI